MGIFARHRRRWLSGTAAVIWLLISILTAPPAIASQRTDHALAAPADGTVGEVHSNRHWSYSQEFPYFRPTDGSLTYVGKVLVTAKITLRSRRVEWVQSIIWLDGPPVQRRIGWNCVHDNGAWFNTSCSGDWRYVTDPEGYNMGTWGRRARYTLEGDGVYWFDFTFGWRALTSWGAEAVWVALPDLPMTSAHFRCFRRDCWF